MEASSAPGTTVRPGLVYDDVHAAIGVTVRGLEGNIWSFGSYRGAGPG